MAPVQFLPDPALRARCTRYLPGHGPRTARNWVEMLAASPRLDERLDEYNEGPAITALERRCADLLGKETALFFHKGVVAQQAALLVHAARTNRRTVALHPRSHIALDEEDAVERLCRLPVRRIGGDHAPFGAAELGAVAEPLAAVTLELPLRRAGFLAPDWGTLAAVSAWCRDRDVPFHLDGARIWEVQPFYGRPLAEIAGLADTVYVSFYKGLGGMGGCVLAGPEAVIAQARVWRSRFGGNLFTAFPLVLTALDGLDRHLPRMDTYFRHAQRIAAALSAVPGLSVWPAQPHCNSFQVRFDAPAAALGRAAAALAAETGTWLFGRFQDLPLPACAFAELPVGMATLDWTPGQVADVLATLLARAQGMAD